MLADLRPRRSRRSPRRSSKQWLEARYYHGVTEPCRVLIRWDHQADGIWLVNTKEQVEATTHEEWSRATEAAFGPDWQTPAHRPWGDRLSDQLLDDLKAWNDSCDWTVTQPYDEIVDDDVLEERGRELAVRVQNELGTDGWEVLHQPRRSRAPRASAGQLAR